MATMLVGTGCSSDDVVNDYSPENAIQFGTYVGRDAGSRGSVVDLEVLKGDDKGFGVFAYYTGTTPYTNSTAFTPNFMKNQQVTWDVTKSKWKYEPEKYWPNNTDDKVSFFAYAPYNEGYQLDQANSYLLPFSVNDDVTSQIDLLWNKSPKLNLTKDNIDDVDDAVKFNFGHALSKVGFTINAGVDLTTVGGTLAPETTIYVDKIEITPLKNSGKLDLSLGTAEWSSLEGAQNYIWDYIYNNDGDTELMNNVLTGSVSEKQLNKESAYLFTIPQALDQNFKITVTYRVFTEDDKLTVPKDGQRNLVPEKPNAKGSLVTNVMTAGLASINSFDAGKQYTINIILGMTSVKIDAEESPWVNGSEENVWFDNNNANNDQTN